MEKVTQFHKKPTVLMCALNGVDLKVSRKVKIDFGRHEKTFFIRGIIYFGGFHFTSRIVTQEGVVWFHDGIATRRQMQKVGNLSSIPNSEILNCHGKKASVVVYSVT